MKLSLSTKNNNTSRLDQDGGIQCCNLISVPQGHGWYTSPTRDATRDIIRSNWSNYCTWMDASSCPSRADTHVLETSMAKGTVSAACVYELGQLNYSSSN